VGADQMASISPKHLESAAIVLHILFKILKPQGPAEIEALVAQATISFQKISLLRCFYPLGDDLKSKALPKGKNGADDGGIVWIGEDILYE